MHSLRSFDRIEDRIRQHRQVENRPVILLEGPDDQLVLRDYVSEDLLFPADGKTNALRAVDALRAWGVSGIRAIVDADFDDDEEDTQVINYEFRDLEGMLISFGALTIVLDHQGSREKLAARGGAEVVSRMIRDLTQPIARLRHENRRQGWGLRFDEVDLTSKVDRKTLLLDEKRYAAALVQASETDVTEIEVREVMSEGDVDDRGPRGRDMAALAGVALRHFVGSLEKAACEESVVSNQVRFAGSRALEQSAWLARLLLEIRVAISEID